MKLWLTVLLPALSLQAELVPRIDPLLLDLRQASRSNQFSRDIDGDGDLDILLLGQATDDLDDDLSLFFEQQADGTFSEAQFFAAPRPGEAVSAIDLNGDGRLDPAILFRESVGTSQSNFRYGARFFPSLPEGGFSDEAVVSFFPADDDDEEFGFTDDSSIPFLLRIQSQSDFRLLINSLLPGDTFGEPEASLALPDQFDDPELSQARWGNFDNSGSTDLLLFQRRDNSTLVWILTRDEDFAESAEPLFTFNSSEEIIRVDDLNQDGLDDIWAPLATGGYQFALRSATGDSFLATQTQTIPALSASVPLGWALDGSNPSLIYFSLTGGDPTSPQSILTTPFGEPAVESTASNFSLLQKNPDSFSPFLTPQNRRPLLLNGSASQAGVTLFTGFSVRRNDFSNQETPGSGSSDLGAPRVPSDFVGGSGLNSLGASAINTVGERLGLGLWTAAISEVSFELFTSAPLNQTSDGSPPIFPADYNMDGLVDLIVGPDFDGNYWLRLNQGNALFEQGEGLPLLPSTFLATNPNLTVDGITVGDIDRDGDPDLVINYLDTNFVDFDQDRAVCLSALNNGDGTFTLPPALPAPFAQGFLSRSCATIALVDWDSDGDLDLIDSSIGWRENQGNGIFSPNTRFLAPPGVIATDAFGNPAIVPTTVSFGDVNGDGNLDILSSLYAFEAGGERFVLDPATGSLILIPAPLDSVFSDDGSIGRDLAAVLLSDDIGRITQTIVLPLEQSGIDALGNPIGIGPTFLSDLDLDGLADIIAAVATTDIFGNPLVLGQRLIRSRGGENPFLLSDLSFVAVSPTIAGPLRDFDGNGTLEHSTANSFVTPTVFGPEYSPTFNFISSRNQLSPTNLLEDFDGDGDLDAIYRQGSATFVDAPFQTFFIARNLILDETSGVTFALRELGVLGTDANPGSDPDHDGKSNFEEFILGCNPLVAESSADRSILHPFFTSENELQFFANEAALAAGISYQLEYSSDLKEWLPVEATTVADEDAIFEIRQAAPFELPSCYYRLVIEP